MSAMSCSEARETLWPIRRPKLLGGPIEEAQRHVEDCAACRDHLAQNHVLRDAYEELRSAKAPIALRERVIAAIAHERAKLEGADPGTSSIRPTDAPARRSTRPSPSRGAWKVAAVAVLTLVAGAVIAQASSRGPERGPDAGAVFVEDYLRRAVGQEHIETSDPAIVRQWLARELGVAMKPLEMAGLELEGAEICLLEGRRGAMIMYKLDGKLISHYLVPREGVEERAPVIGRATADQEGVMPPLVTWSTPSMEQALVGELESGRLLEVARASF